MKINILYDNRKDNPALQEGWGFSCLIEKGKRRMLFDTGADQGAFFSNLQQLAIPLETITDAAFSHKHSDHVTGLQEIVGSMSQGIRLFLPKGFPTANLPSFIQPTFVSEFAEIDAGIYSFVLKGGFRLYEQALVFQTRKGLVVITGCAHMGITNLLEAVKTRLNSPIHLVLGGFHLFKKSRQAVSAIVDRFQSLEVELAAPCHCSGDGPIAQFQEAYQDRFCRIGTGTILTLED